jgi:hypothetical protein
MAYLSIPITLVYFIRRRRDLAFHGMFALFAIFIVACGTTHLMEIWLIWHPTYWLAGIVKTVTAAASVPTAILLVKLVPRALELPSPAMLQKANEELQREIAERERAQAELDVTHRRLLDASRQAGMAEVATNVLHNVGNVLNSANVSVNLIVEAAEQSKVSSLARVVTVLREHDLHTFMTGDPRQRAHASERDESARRGTGPRRPGRTVVECRQAQGPTDPRESHRQRQSRVHGIGL